MHYDLIVIGMGLSGLMAAKTAVESGKKVLLIGKGIGSLSLFSNTIDVLGSLQIGTKLSEGLSKWVADHPRHPYSKVGVQSMEEALYSFKALFPPPYDFQSIGDTNCTIPTGAGTFRPTYFIPSTMFAGVSMKEGETLIVGFKCLKDFYANYVADHLKCRGIDISLPEIIHQEISSVALSRLMEKESFRQAIGQEIKKCLQGETRIGLPAILGLQNPIQVKKDLEANIGVEVFEIPILPPSIPGIRIFNRFREWLIKRGCTLLFGNSVSKVIVEGKRCKEIYVSNPPISHPYYADRIILATGRFISGGLIAEMNKIIEPVFHLPVTQPKCRDDWFRNTFFDDIPHPIHQSGIMVDPSFRPVDARGDTILENVWIAGSILAGHNYIAEKSREGIEITTGYMAAKWAIG